MDYSYVLVFVLTTHGPRVEVLAHDCAEAAPWMREATAWAQRSHIDPLDGPIAWCFERETWNSLHPRARLVAAQARAHER